MRWMRWCRTGLFISSSACETLPSTSSCFSDGSNLNSCLNSPSRPPRKKPRRPSGAGMRPHLSQHARQRVPQSVGVQPRRRRNGELHVLARRVAGAALTLVCLAVAEDAEQILDVVIAAAEGAGQAHQHRPVDGIALRSQVVHGRVERLPHEDAPDAIDIGGGEPGVVLADDGVGQELAAIQVADGAAGRRLAVEGSAAASRRPWRIVLARHTVFAEAGRHQLNADQARIAAVAHRPRPHPGKVGRQFMELLALPAVEGMIVTFGAS